MKNLFFNEKLSSSGDLGSFVYGDTKNCRTSFIDLKLHTQNNWLEIVVATLGLHLGFSAKPRIWQVPACKMEPRSGMTRLITMRSKPDYVEFVLL